MITCNDLITYLINKFPDYSNIIYNGCLGENVDKCIGVFSKNRSDAIVSFQHFGSLKSKSVSILVHWGQDANEAETVANTIWETLFNEKLNTQIGNYRLVNFQMLDDTPVNIDRDENNICEYTIRLNILYE